MKETVKNVRTGEEVLLTSLWADRRILLTLLRHLGCPLCIAHIDEILSLSPLLSQFNTPPVFVSLGSVEGGRFFLSKYPHVTAELYVCGEEGKDGVYPPAGVYNLLKMTRPATYEKLVSDRAMQILGSGKYPSLPHIVGSPQEWPYDFLQVGGVLIMGPGNVCSYSYKSQYAADTPSLDELSLFIREGKRGEGKGGREKEREREEERESEHTSEGEGDREEGRKGKGGEEDTSINGGDTEVSHTFVHPRTAAWVEQMQMDQVLPDPALNPDMNNASPTTSRLNILFDTFSFLIAFLFLLSAFSFFHVTPAVTVVTSIISAALAYKYSSLLSLSSLSPSASASPPSSLPLRLLTPREVDELMICAGNIDCDCPMVLQRIPLLGELTEQDALEMEAEIEKEEKEEEEGKREGGRKGKALSSCPISPIPATDLAAASKTLCFLREFLAKPHPLLTPTRKGPVCPFMPTALRKNTVYLGVVHTNAGAKEEDIISILRPLAENFATYEPTEGPLVNYKTIVLAFPDVSTSNAKRLIDGVQSTLKPDFVSRGLMIGEFYRHNNAPSLSNAEFFPLRTPVPTLAIRHMVTGDIAFLDLSKYSPQIRCAFLQSYIHRFEGDSKAQDTIERAKRELEKSQMEL